MESLHGHIHCQRKKETLKITTTSAEIKKADDKEDGLILTTTENLHVGLHLFNDSGYWEAIGNSGGWFPQNFVFLVLSQDGNMIHGAVKTSEMGNPLPWWSVRQ
jgi:hypothetical protein